MKVGKLKKQDKKIRSWLKQGGREGAKKDFVTLLKRAANS